MTIATASVKPSDALTRNQRLELYYYVRLTRDVEERVNVLHRQGKVIGAVYRSLGQEGESVATAYALDRGVDALSPLTRNLGALFTMGVRPRDMYLQYMGKGSSPGRGRDLSNHFAHLPDMTRPDARGPIIIGPVSPLGDMVAVMGGIALGAKLRKKPLVAMVYIGDGGTSTGVFHEAMNFAAVKQLPLVVVAEDNKFAYSTPVRQQMAIESIDRRAEAYGMAHEMVDGNDVLGVYDLARARGRSGARRRRRVPHWRRHDADERARRARRHAVCRAGARRTVDCEGSACAVSQAPRSRRERDTERARRDRCDDEGLRRSRGAAGRRGA